MRLIILSILSLLVAGAANADEGCPVAQVWAAEVDQKLLNCPGMLTVNLCSVEDGRDGPFISTQWARPGGGCGGEIRHQTTVSVPRVHPTVVSGLSYRVLLKTGGVGRLEAYA